MALVMNQMPGVVENGLFIDICDAVVIGYGDGRVEVRDINEGTVDRDKMEFVAVSYTHLTLPTIYSV